MTDADDAPDPPNPAEQTGAYAPKPPLWQPARTQRATFGVAILSALGVVFLAGVMSVGWLEQHVLTTAPQETLVTITRIEGTAPADEEHPERFRYIVALPDGSEARFSSERLYAVGTRLQAMVSRNRITRRQHVNGPYHALPRVE